MNEQRVGVTCPNCDEHFMVGVLDVDTHVKLAAAQKRIVELEARHAALHDALRTMGQSWLTLAVSLAADPRRQGESVMLKDCADELARAFNAVRAGDAGGSE